MIQIRTHYDQSGMPEPIFIHHINPYGYRINVTHPDIIPLYTKWRIEHGESTHYPPSDKCRMEFEDALIAYLYTQLPPWQRPPEVAELYAQMEADGIIDPPSEKKA